MVPSSLRILFQKILFPELLAFSSQQLFYLGQIRARPSSHVLRQAHALLPSSLPGRGGPAGSWEVHTRSSREDTASPEVSQSPAHLTCSPLPGCQCLTAAPYVSSPSPAQGLLLGSHWRGTWGLRDPMTTRVREGIRPEPRDSVPGLCHCACTVGGSWHPAAIPQLLPFPGPREAVAPPGKHHGAGRHVPWL